MINTIAKEHRTFVQAIFQVENVVKHHGLVLRKNP